MVTKCARIVAGCLFLAGIFACAASSVAQDYTFSWSPSEEQIDGYKLYYKKGGAATAPFDGTDAEGGASPITLANVTSYTITGLDADAIYHFALTVYDEVEESSLSAVITIDPRKINWSLPAPQDLNIQ